MSTTTRAGVLGAQERFYVGRRPGETEVYVVTLHDVQRLSPHGGDDDAAFAWGPDAWPGGGALACAILCHATGRQPPEPVCMEFQAQVVASLPRAGFVLGCDDIALWLAAERREPRTWRPLRGPAGDVRRTGVMGLLSRLFRREQSRAHD